MKTDEQAVERLAKDIGETWVTDLDGNVKDLHQILWSTDIENIAIELHNIGYRKQSEVAREIFAEIADNLRGLFDFFRQDGCIRESSAIMLAISEIAELKKKFVPDTDFPTKVSSGDICRLDICRVCGEPIPKERQVCPMCEVGQKYLKKKE